MRFGIVVDATCDLPPAFFAQDAVVVLPITVQMDDETFIDKRDLAATLEYCRSGAGVHAHGAGTVPFSAEQIEGLFLQRLVLDYDGVFCLTVTASRSRIHEHATEASYAILRKYQPIRRAAGLAGPFLLRVIDTQNVFAAQGVTATEALRLMATDTSPGRIRERLESIANHTWGYLIPRDLRYLRSRARKRGDRSVSLMTAAVGGALDIKPILQCYRGATRPVHKARGFKHAAAALFAYTTERVAQGLLTRTLCLSYGGDLEDLDGLPGYAALREACNEHRITLETSVMSITGMVNVGPGGLSLGFAAEPHTPRFG